jgi:O-antigen ligase
MIEYNNFPAESTHNGFIEVFLAYGAIGLTLLMGAILTSVIRPSVTSHLKVQKPIARIIPQGILLLGVLLPLLVESYSWAWIGSPTLSIWMGFCLTQNTKSNQKQPETTRTF